MLAYEVKRKEHIAVFVARAAFMSDAEVMGATEKGIMKWMKQEIVAARTRAVQVAHLEEVSASLADHVIDGKNDDPLGMTCMWNGDDQFIDINGGKSAALMVRYGDLVWFAKSGGVWIDTVFSKVIDPKLSNVIQQSEMTKTAYSDAVRQKRLKNAPANAPQTVVAGAAPVSPLTALGVRFG